MKKRKKGRALLSLVTALAMVFSTLAGIVPGTSLTVYADSTQAYTDYLVTTDANENKSGDDLTALQVTFNDSKWYIIEDNSTSATSGTVTLLAADTSFGTMKFNSTYNNSYNASVIKSYLDNQTKAGGDFAAVAEAIETVNLTTYQYNSTNEYESVQGVKLYLLSTEEANSLPANVRMTSFDGYNYWWLRSPGMP